MPRGARGRRPLPVPELGPGGVRYAVWPADPDARSAAWSSPIRETGTAVEHCWTRRWCPPRRPGSVTTDPSSSPGRRRADLERRRRHRQRRRLCRPERVPGSSRRRRTRPASRSPDRGATRDGPVPRRTGCRATARRSRRSTRPTGAVAVTSLALDADGSRLAVAWLTDGGSVRVLAYERAHGWRVVDVTDDRPPAAWWRGRADPARGPCR